MSKLTRHLAAVMFTDMVDYTKLIATDEKAGLAAPQEAPGRPGGGS